MRILISVLSLHNGGAERVAVEWSRGFVERGYEVGLVLCCPPETPVSYTPPPQVSIQNIYPERCKRLFYQLTVAKNLRKYIKHFRPDIFISVHGRFAHLIAPVGLGIKTINTEHNAFERPESAPMSFKTKFYKFYLNRLYPKVTVLTSRDAMLARAKGINAFYLPNPLAFEPVQEISPKKKVILAAGRLDAGYVKGFDILIKAFAMASKNREWMLHIAGSGKPEDFKKYKEIAKNTGISNQVRFLGYVKNPIQLYRDSAVFVLSSRFEGFGLVLIEAMSQGCACIACDYGGRQKEIVGDKKNAICCKVDDVSDLSKALEKVMCNEDLRISLQKNGIERSKCFDVNKIIDRWEAIFNN